jgi:hypothetical protein
MGIISGGNVMPSNGLGYPLQKAGAIVANDFAGSVVVGGQAIDTTNGKAYICTATNGTTTATWVVVGAQV